nr:hypothetical protein Iba_chr03bCG12880 [Ipomoea batatas]
MIPDKGSMRSEAKAKGRERSRLHDHKLIKELTSEAVTFSVPQVYSNRVLNVTFANKKSAENREEEAADETGTEKLKQELAAAREVSGGEKEVSESGVGAGQKAVGLLAFTAAARTSPVGHEPQRETTRAAGE